MVVIKIEKITTATRISMRVNPLLVMASHRRNTEQKSLQGHGKILWRRNGTHGYPQAFDFFHGRSPLSGGRAQKKCILFL